MRSYLVTAAIIAYALPATAPLAEEVRPVQRPAHSNEARTRPPRLRRSSLGLITTLDGTDWSARS